MILKDLTRLGKTSGFPSFCFLIIVFLIAVFYFNLFIQAPNIYENVYDYFRIFSILIFVTIILLPLKEKTIFIPLRYKIFFSLFFLLGLLSLFFYEKNLLIVVREFLLVLLIFLSTEKLCSFISKNNFFYIDSLILFLFLLPILNIFEFLMSIYFSFYGVDRINWIGEFSNIRFHDSTLMLVIFFGWYLIDVSRNKFKRRMYIFNCLIFLYMLSIFFNGSRSVLISIIITLVICTVLNLKRYREYIKCFLVFFLCGLFYILYFMFSVRNIDGLDRITTSGRDLLWHWSWNNILEHPLAGIGGGNFAYYRESMPGRHPHNFILQLLVDWGVAGFSLSIFIFLIFLTVIKNHKNIPVFLFCAFIAFVLDTMFSGMMVPMMQMNCILISAIVLSFIGYEKQPYRLKNKIIFFLVACVMVFLLMPDILCFHCDSYDGHKQPRFWSSGTVQHLE